MAERDQSKFFYRDRWTAVDVPTAGSAAAATGPAGVLNSQSRVFLDVIIGSIWNSNAASTVPLKVTVASAAGSVIATIDNIVPTSTTGNVNYVSLGIPIKRGQKPFVTVGTAVASLTSKLCIVGWLEDGTG